MHAKFESYERFVDIKDRLGELWLKALHEADVEKACLNHAMHQMQVWNTYSKTLLQKIIDEPDPMKKVKLAEHTINWEQILSHDNRGKNHLPDLPPETVTPEPSEPSTPPTPKEPTPEKPPTPEPEPKVDSSIEEVDFNIQDNLFKQVEDQFHTGGVVKNIPAKKQKKKKGHLLNERDRKKLDSDYEPSSEGSEDEVSAEGETPEEEREDK